MECVMEPWYKVVTPRKEVREGRSFNPDEFAIALEQVVAGTAPEDYVKPAQFFERTVFTRALREHAGMVLRRLAGQTVDTAPVLTLVTQFGGGKTHALTALYHLSTAGPGARELPGIGSLLESAGLSEVPAARPAVFVGNAWDPQNGSETPWIDIARQLAGDPGVALLGSAALTAPPGTETLGRLFEAAGGSVLVLCDEVLNLMSRHRSFAEPFRDFLQNLTVAMTGMPRSAAVISLPRSQIEMTDWDFEWQERITKVVKRVSRDLIVNDEAEIGEVVRRRLFQDLGDERIRRRVATAYADWCFDRRSQLPPEWTSVDTATSDKQSKDLLRDRFERAYPFHPATLSVFQRKWQSLPQYQQTRGTLAMLGQWVSQAYQEGFMGAANDAVIALGSAPLHVAAFRSTVLGQLGEARLLPAVEADIAGDVAHARALDSDTKGALRGIHRRVATAILFESSGGQQDKVAHGPELRYALGEPGVDTTSIDNAAAALDGRAFYIRRIGSDGYKIGHKAKLSKIVADRRASLDPEEEVPATIRDVVAKEFSAAATLPIVRFPGEASEIADLPRLTLIVANPDWEWTGSGDVRERIAEWTRSRGTSDRLYPGSLVWCVRRPGRDLREAVELMLAWRRVRREVADGTLGGDYDATDLADLEKSVKGAEGDAKDEVWAGYRYAAIWEPAEAGDIKVIDLGAGHASSSESLTGRIIAALKAEALLNEAVGAGYLERHWPSAFAETGAWPLASLRQAFLNGTLTRLIDPDRVLKAKIVEFVANAEMGLGSGQRPEGTFERVWFGELVSPDEVTFDVGVYLLTRSAAEAAKALSEGIAPAPSGGESAIGQPSGEPTVAGGAGGTEATEGGTGAVAARRVIRLMGAVPPEMWNRLGTRIVARLRSASDVEIRVEASASADEADARRLEQDLRLALAELGLEDGWRIEEA
jgi:hypothetical protein